MPRYAKFSTDVRRNLKAIKTVENSKIFLNTYYYIYFIMEIGKMVLTHIKINA